MKKIFAVIVVLLLTSSVYSQGMKFGIGGGLSVVSSPAFFTNDISTGFSTGLGFSTETHVGLLVKFNLPLVPVTPYAFGKYHWLSGENTTPLGDFKTSSNLLSIGGGVQYNLIPGPIKPYLALEVAYNNMKAPEIEYPASYGLAKKSLGDDISRFGLGLGVGADINLMIINIDANLKYNMINLIGKEDGEESIGILTFTASLMF